MSDSFLYNGCSSDSEIAAGHSIQGVVCSPYMDPNALVMFGLLPDGVNTVDVSLADGSTKTIDIQNNFFNYETTKSAPAVLRVSWAASDGLHSPPSSLPPDAGKTTCAKYSAPSQVSAWARSHETTQQASQRP